MATPRGRIASARSLAVAFLLTAIIFTADYLSGSEISVSFFYLFPVGLSTWTVGRRAGIGFSILATAGWSAAYFLTRRFYSNPNILYWNAGVELATFLAVTLALAAARDGLRKERALQGQLESAYFRLDDEQRVVGDIQRSLLPRTPPEIRGFRLAIHYAPSARAGGDYYDFFPLDHERVGLMIADVSGHGTPAAVVMAMMRVLLHTSPEPLDPPEATLTRINERIREFTLQDQFATACYCVVDGPRRSLEYALAGHNPPLLVRAGSGDVEEFENPCGPPLGPFVTPAFTRRSARLDPGDTVLFYTDGLTEAADAEGRFLGVERVRELMLDARTEPPEGLRDRLVDAMRRHAGGAAPADDVTLLVMRAG